MASHTCQVNEVIKKRNEVNSMLYSADATAAETEADTDAAQNTIDDQRFKTEEAEAEELQLAEQLRQEELAYETKLTEVYNAHREQVEALAIEITTNDEDVQQVWNS